MKKEIARIVKREAEILLLKEYPDQLYPLRHVRYILVQRTTSGKQEIYLHSTEMITILQAIVTDFGKKMPSGIKVIMKLAEEEEKV